MIIFDTLQLLANVIIENDLADFLTSTSVSCQKETVWDYGQAFISHLKTANLTGLSGEITFNSKTGERNNPFLYIVDMTKEGVDLVRD